MFREYCRLFYGPAEQEMLAFFDFCEANWQQMEKDKVTADAALELFAVAKSRAEPGSVFGQRLALIDDYLGGLRSKSEQLAQKRGPVPVLRLVGDASEILIDGKLDDEYWQKCPVAASGRLRELQTGRPPIFESTIQSGWAGDSIYFAIRCEEQPGEKLNIAATREDETAVWYGDVVEILLETESHSYYQIAVSPTGAIVDLDRQGKKRDLQWDSQAEVATQIADDHWTIEIRIPVTQDANDPLHQVIGRKPTQSLPWHINVCRQRIRDNGSEYSAFSPTGTPGFHETLKFAHFYGGRSHRFPYDASVSDYLIASRAATELVRQRNYQQALATFVSLAEGKVTDFQKSDALQRAANCARSLQEFDRAADLADRIPIEAVAKTVRMQNLNAQRRWRELIEQFASEEIGKWPFWQAGEAYFARGRAYWFTQSGKEAEADLTRALTFISDTRTRQSVWLTIGQNREQNLNDSPAALTAYQAVIAGSQKIGGADEFASVQGIARILTGSGKFDEALAALGRADIEHLRGSWRGTLLLALAETQYAAGRPAQAIATYQSLLDDTNVEPRHRKTAENRLQAINTKQP